MPNKTNIQKHSTELIASRILNAPIELVWKNWSDAQLLGQWWGPFGFSITTHEFEFKEGGIWKFIMHGPERDFHDTIIYTQIVPFEKITYHIAGEGEDNELEFTTYVEFEKIAPRQTRVTTRAKFAKAETLRFVIETHNADQGAEQHFARMAQFIEAQT